MSFFDDFVAGFEAVGGAIRDFVEGDDEETREPEESEQTEPAGQSGQTLADLDTDGDGVVSDEIAGQSASDGSIGGDIAAGPQVGGEVGLGAPLWPFAVKDPTVFEGLDARYHEIDLLAPAHRWSEEDRAALQRSMQQIGLYGDRQVRLGSWTAADHEAFKALLEASNVADTTWDITLQRWKAAPPVDILQDLTTGAQRPTVQVTNPLDIRQTAQRVSQNLTGAVDRDFAQSVVPEFQAAESGAQGAVFNDQAAGGGGQTVQPPSMEAFIEDQLRREQPLEVDGFEFLNQFGQFMSMLGAQ